MVQELRQASNHWTQLIASLSTSGDSLLEEIAALKALIAQVKEKLRDLHDALWLVEGRIEERNLRPVEERKDDEAEKALLIELQEKRELETDLEEHLEGMVAEVARLTGLLGSNDDELNDANKARDCDQAGSLIMSQPYRESEVANCDDELAALKAEAQENPALEVARRGDFDFLRMITEWVQVHLE